MEALLGNQMYDFLITRGNRGTGVWYCECRPQNGWLNLLAHIFSILWFFSLVAPRRKNVMHWDL